MWVRQVTSWTRSTCGLEMQLATDMAVAMYRSGGLGVLHRVLDEEVALRLYPSLAHFPAAKKLRGLVHAVPCQKNYEYFPPILYAEFSEFLLRWPLILSRASSS